MGTPPSRPARLADPRFYLKAVIVIAGLGLVALTIGADAVTLATSPKASNDCRVLSVIDGDTVRLWCPVSGAEKARLMGFDTPEVFSPRCAGEFTKGVAATWSLRRILFAADSLSVVRRGTDRYGRTLVYMATDGYAVATQMIEAGHARTYSGGARKGWCG